MMLGILIGMVVGSMLTAATACAVVKTTLQGIDDLPWEDEA